MLVLAKRLYEQIVSQELTHQFSVRIVLKIKLPLKIISKSRSICQNDLSAFCRITGCDVNSTWGVGAYLTTMLQNRSAFKKAVFLRRIAPDVQNKNILVKKNYPVQYVYGTSSVRQNLATRTRQISTI
jgi:hypothetical protein